MRRQSTPGSRTPGDGRIWLAARAARSWRSTGRLGIPLPTSSSRRGRAMVNLRSLHPSMLESDYQERTQRWGALRPLLSMEAAGPGRSHFPLDLPRRFGRQPTDPSRAKKRARDLHRTRGVTVWVGEAGRLGEFGQDSVNPSCASMDDWGDTLQSNPPRQAKSNSDTCSCSNLGCHHAAVALWAIKVVSSPADANRASAIGILRCDWTNPAHTLPIFGLQRRTSRHAGKRRARRETENKVRKEAVQNERRKSKDPKWDALV